MKRFVLLMTLASYLFSVFCVPLAQASLWQERKSAMRASQSQAARQQAFISAATSEICSMTSSMTGSMKPGTSPWPLTRLNDVKFPSAFGSFGLSDAPEKETAKETAEETAPLVIHLQDAHNNAIAQQNASEILRWIARTAPLQNPDGSIHIFVEGFSNKIYTRWFHAFPSQSLRNYVARLLLEQGKINGEEYFALTAETPEKIQISGIENDDLYHVNLNTRLEVDPFRHQIISRFSQDESLLQKIEREIGNAPFNRLLQNANDFDSGKIGLNQYARVLSKEMDLSKNFQSVEQLLALSDYEQNSDAQKT